MIRSFLLVTVLFAGLTSCSQFDAKSAVEDKTPPSNSSLTSTAEDQTSPPSEETSTSDQASSVKNFTTESLYSLLVAEIAASRREYSLTLNNYVEQAYATNDVAIVARAARLSQLFRKQETAIEMGNLWLTIEPNNQEALGTIINAHINLKDLIQATDITERLLNTLSPSDKRANAKAAILETIAARSRNSQPETLNILLTRYEALNEQYPQYSSILVGKSILEEHAGTIDSALKTAQRAQQKDKEYLPAILQEVRLLRTLDMSEEALSKLKNTYRQQPDNPRIRLSYARLLVQINPPDALKELESLTERYPDELDVRFLYSLVALETDQYEKAEGSLLQLIEANYQLNSTSYYLGTIYQAQNQPQKALEIFQSIPPSDEFIAAQEQIGIIYSEQDQLSLLKKHFDTQRAKLPDLDIPLYIAEASVFAKLGDVDEAINVLTLAAETYPEDTGIRFNRSSYFEQADRLQEMEEDLRFILNAEPDNASALNALGYFLTIRTNRFTEAKDLIEKALSFKPNEAAFIDSLGWVNFKLGNTDKALKLLEQAFNLFPDPEVASHLGEVLWVLDEQEKAKRIWFESLEENPDNQYLLEVIKRFNVSQ